jgi:hypothetical protein
LRRCGTPGCRLPDFHTGPCSSWSVPAKRKPRPVERHGTAADRHARKGPRGRLDDAAREALNGRRRRHGERRDRAVERAAGIGFGPAAEGNGDGDVNGDSGAIDIEGLVRGR